jgi:hypothetical protein
LFSISLCRFGAERLAHQPLERRGVSHRRPELEFGVAAGPDLQQVVVAAIVQFQTGDHL